MNSEPNPTQADDISLRSVFFQFGLMCAIFYLWSSPWIQPVKIMVVLFHEMSHGLMALLTGGKVLNIFITPDEGGACETEGGMPLLIVSAGYLGSMLFGGLILYLSRFRSFVPVVFGMLTLTVVSAVVTVMGDPYSKKFAAMLAGSFIIAGFLVPSMVGRFALQVLGTVCCLYSIFDIYWDVLADRTEQAIQNDAIVFSSLSGMDARTVGTAWLVASVILFLAVLRSTMKGVVGDESPAAA